MHDLEDINPEDDYDEDGLTNKEEYEEGTNPGTKDTDGDGLNDYEEINKYHTNPLVYDTDEDGLGDGTEINNGFDPLKKDSDNDGTLDGKDKIENQILTDQIRSGLDVDSMSAVPDLTITGSGDYSFQIRMEDYSYNQNYASLDYLVSEVTRIYHNSAMEFDSATLTYHISEDILKENKIEDLSIVRLEGNKVIPVDTTYDKEQNTISATVDELCDYAVENKKEREYNTDITNLSSVIEKGKADVVFAIDTTGSMGGSISNVKNNLLSIAERLDEKKLDVRFGLVEFRDITADGINSTKDHGWFTSAEDFKTAISALSVNGGGDGPESAVDALDKVKSMTYRKNYGKYVVLITDAPYKNGTVTNASYTMSEMIQELQKEDYIVSVVSYSSYESTYRELYNTTNGIYADITGNFFDEINPLLDKIEEEENDEEYEWVRLSNYDLVKISKDPTVDSDGIPDRTEVSEEEFKAVDGVMARLYRSHPLEADTDGDGMNDGEDSQPLVFNVIPKYINTDMENPVVTLNTGKAFQVFFSKEYTINDFLRKYNTKDLQLDKLYLKGIYDTLSAYRKFNYTIDELVCIGMLDEGVMKFIAQNMSDKDKCTIFERVIGQEPRIETTEKKYKFLWFDMTKTVTVNEVLDYFKLESMAESWSQYFLVALEQVIKGKYADESNMIGTVGEIGVAFTGLDVVQDLRDLSYDITNWEWSWGYVGETALDAVGLVPLVGVLAKGDTVTVLIKHTDEVYELRKVAKLDTLLETIKKIDGRITDLVGSANVVIKNLGQKVSASLYKALDNVKINNKRYALATGYDTIFASAFDDLADEAKELYDLSPTAVQQAYRKAILESTDMTGKVVKSEEEITEAGRKAIAEKKAEVLAGKGGTGTSTIRIADEVLDSELLKNANAMKGKLPTWAQNTGNFGYCETNIDGLDKTQYFAHSGIQTEIPSVKDSGISIKPEESPFTTSKVNSSNIVDAEDAWQRDVDTEYKILSDIQSRLGDNYSASGKIVLYTELEPCPSCLNVIKQFKDIYSNINIEVVYSLQK